MRAAVLRLFLPVIVSLTSACVSVQTQPRLYVFSDPSGASVLIDGVDTGFTTPAQVDPSSGDVTVVKEGYLPQTRSVKTVVDFRYPRWQDGGVVDYTVTFCLLRVWRDVLFPFQFSVWESPRRLYFKLEPLDE